MKEKAGWTGEVVKRLHVSGISQAELAREMGVTHVWVSTLLNSAKPAAAYKQRMLDAIEAIKQKRGGDE